MSTHVMNTGSEADTSKTPAPEGHNDKMAAAFDASQKVPETGVPETPKAERPDHIPEKFWKDGAVDVEALAKSYTELEKGKSKEPEKAPEGEPKTAEQVTPEEAGSATPDDAAKALESVGLNYAEINARFHETGELASSDREALNKAGVPDGMIDAYVEGQKARAAAYDNSVMESVGGADEFKKMTVWASNNLPKAEAQAINDAWGSFDLDKAKLAAAGLKSRYESAMGAEPTLQKGGTLPPSVGDVFESNAQLVTAMQNPLYKTDPAYRNAVIQKLNRSSIM